MYSASMSTIVSKYNVPSVFIAYPWGVGKINIDRQYKLSLIQMIRLGTNITFFSRVSCCRSGPEFEWLFVKPEIYTYAYPFASQYRLSGGSPLCRCRRRVHVVSVACVNERGKDRGIPHRSRSTKDPLAMNTSSLPGARG